MRMLKIDRGERDKPILRTDYIIQAHCSRDAPEHAVQGRGFSQVKAIALVLGVICTDSWECLFRKLEFRGCSCRHMLNPLSFLRVYAESTSTWLPNMPVSPWKAFPSPLFSFGCVLRSHSPFFLLFLHISCAVFI